MFLHLSWQVIELHGVVSHTIHELPVLWILRFFPYDLSFSCLAINNSGTLTPPSFNLVYNVVSAEDLSLSLLIRACTPPTLEEFYSCIRLFGACHVFNSCFSDHIQIGGPDDDVVD
jgi:hypothetical protein